MPAWTPAQGRWGARPAARTPPSCPPKPSLHEGPTLTKASRTSSACSLLSGVDTVSPRVMRVRLVRQPIRSGGFTWCRHAGAHLPPVSPPPTPALPSPFPPGLAQNVPSPSNALPVATAKSSPPPKPPDAAYRDFLSLTVPLDPPACFLSLLGPAPALALCIPVSQPR